jgi:phosphoribosylglycinamide formyltransferase-1
MQSLIEDMQTDTNHPGKTVLVVSNNDDAEGLTFAKKKKIDTFSYPTTDKKNIRAFEVGSLNILLEKKVDLICLAGFMQILSSFFIKGFKKKIINIHPSILPSFKGLYTHERVLKSGSLIHGATVHQVTEKVDVGPILGQVVVAIPSQATAKSLSELLLPYEHLLYKKVLREQLTKENKVLITEGRYSA